MKTTLESDLNFLISLPQNKASQALEKIEAPALKGLRRGLEGLKCLGI